MVGSYFIALLLRFIRDKIYACLNIIECLNISDPHTCFFNGNPYKKFDTFIYDCGKCECTGNNVLLCSVEKNCNFVIVGKNQLSYVCNFRCRDDPLSTGTRLDPIILIITRCPWCNGYRRRKWTRWYEFESWTRQIAFHIALIPLEKVWIQLFSLQLWVNSRPDWVLQSWWDN